MSNRYKRTALVLGGGHNGLICATLLARSGFQVTLIEAGPSFGGAVSTYRFACGCEISQAANVISLLDVEILRLIDNYYGIDWASFFLVPDPQLIVLTASSKIVLRPIDAASLASDLSKQTAEPVDSLLSFFKDVDSAASAVSHLWTDPQASHETLARALAAAHPTFPDLFLFNSIKTTIQRYFASEDLQLVFGALNSIVAAPFTDSGTSFCLLYLASGNLPFSPSYAIPHAGMGRLAKLLEDTAIKAGVTLNSDEAVTAINIETDNGGKVSSILTSRNRRLSADVYISAFGPIATDRLLSPSYAESVVHGRPSVTAHETACAKLNCLIPSDLALQVMNHHNQPSVKVILCGGLDELTSAASDARLGLPTEYPYIEILAPSLIGAEAACGLHVPISLYALYFPYKWCFELGERMAIEAITQRVLASLARWMPGLCSKLQIVEVLTPLSLERKFNMWRGDVDHGSFADGNILERRGYGLLPHGRTEIRNLYNCSAGIHPGGLVSGRPALTCAKTIAFEAGFS